LPAFFTLSRYCQQRSNDATALHLLSLVCERLGQHAYGADLAERSIAILETAYEEAEDPEVEMRYTIANCTLGRLRLSLGQFEGAGTSFESAHGLLADKELQSRQIIVLGVQVHLGLGLANFFLGDLEASLRFLEEGLQIASPSDNYGNGSLRTHLVILLAQVLWAIGTEGAKEGAKSRLLEW
jgi:superkiller protein 3